ncbi:RNA-directed DNA polymerase, eukaryota [Tanacetum coccineum]
MYRPPKLQGIDFLSHCKRRVGLGMQTRFWEDLWLGDVPFNEFFPRLYALENNKECSVTVKMQGEIDSSFRRHVRGGVETQQLENIQDLVRSKVLSNVDDRWAWDLNGGGDFCVKDARDLVDEVLLPKENVATRWIKTIPIKVNVFAWKLHLDRLPTRSNLLKRGIQVQSSLCPICNVLQEDTSHLFFSCDVALAISRLICRWWNVSWSPVDSYSGWLEWFNSIRLGSKLKGILEGVFYVSWWCLWNFRNQLLFASKKPRKETLFDNVVSHPNTNLKYDNMLYAQIDVVCAGIKALGHTDVHVRISETGWPSKGDVDEPNATVENAGIYNRNLLQRMQQGQGTPAHPSQRILYLPASCLATWLVTLCLNR